MKGKVVFPLILCLIFSTYIFSINKVSAYVDSKTIGIQDYLTLTIKVEGENSNSAAVKDLGNLENFSIISGPNISTQVSIINGSFSSSKTFTYQLAPERVGEFTIGPFTVQIGDKTYRISSIKIKVVKGRLKRRKRSVSPFDFFDNFGSFDEDFGFGRRQRQNMDLTNDVFLKMEVDKRKVYLGEPIVATLVLYFRVPIASADFIKTGSMDGFWIYEEPQKKKPEQANVFLNGKNYIRYVIRRWVLIPTKSGKLTLSPWIISLIARVERSFFDFGSDVKLRRTSNPVDITVLPLPEGSKPENFSGLVGNYRIEAKLKKNKLKVGEATTLTIKIKGRGNLYTFSDIDLPKIDGLKIYPPKISGKQRIGKGGYFVEKDFEYVIIPKKSGKFEISGVKISYFNLDKKEYEVLTSPSLILNVENGGNNETFLPPPSTTYSEPQLLNKDIYFIKSNFQLRDDSRFLCERKIYWGIFFLIFLLNILAIFFEVRREKLLSNFSEYRKSTAYKNFLKKMKNCGKKKDKPEKIECMYEAVNEYLKDRFLLTSIEISRNNLKKLLSEKNVSGELIEKLISNLNRCEAAKFIKSELEATDEGKLLEDLMETVKSLEEEVGKIENR